MGERLVLAASPAECGVAPPVRSCFTEMRIVVAILMVIAADDEQTRSVRAPHPVLQLRGRRLCDAELGQHDDVGAGLGGAGDEPVDLVALMVHIDRADGECPAARIARQYELVETPVRVSGRNQRPRGDEPGEGVGEPVIEDHPELDGPVAGQSDVAGLVKSVGEAPGRRREGHRREFPEVR